MSLLQRQGGRRKTLATRMLQKASSSLRARSRSRSHSKSNSKGSRSFEESAGLQLGICTAQSDKHATNEDKGVFSAMVEHDHPVLTAFAAVFDGHGGDQCSTYVSEVIETHLREHFKDEDAWDNGEEVMKEVFHQIDTEFCDIAKEKENFSGACATVVALKNDEVIIGNIGDCRAMLVPINSNGNHSEPVELTVDHRADATAEELRINEAGGEVQNGRVLNLQPSRSFGDIDVKHYAGKGVVTATPDVDRLFIFVKSSGKSERPFMVIATDGVWDDVSMKQVNACAKATLKKTNYDASLCAEKIVELAIKSGSTDDITAIVLVW